MDEEMDLWKDELACCSHLATRRGAEEGVEVCLRAWTGGSDSLKEKRE